MNKSLKGDSEVFPEECPSCASTNLELNEDIVKMS
jgi:hypothetical protein